jgi:glucose-6-phosphate 1-dehydrogenase
VLRAGKCLPVTATEVRVRLKHPPVGLFGPQTPALANEFCFRLSPDVFIALTARVKAPGERMVGTNVRLVEHDSQGDAMPPYERLLGDALRGDHSLFGNEAGIDAAWRIVDPVLMSAVPPSQYDRGTWGPAEADRIAADVGGWIAPAADD